MKTIGKKTNAPTFDKEGYQKDLVALNGELLPDPKALVIKPLRGGVRMGAGRKPAGRQAMLFRLKPETAARLRAETSILPFGAILAGRNRLVLAEIGWLAPLLALIGWAAVLHFHARFFGVPALLPF